jgi:exopolyphosphatase/guanosine-5'-triphosphate,3'-diphosphate pyrophosphatase
MAIAEITPAGEINVLETPAKPVSIGRDVFTAGRISRATRGEVIDVLSGFKRLMDSYQVKVSRVIATSALREAADRDTFVDWAFVRTGIDIEVIEGIQENQLTFSAVQSVLGDRLGRPGDSLIIEVGGGSTELMVLHAGQIVLSQTLPLGAVRMQQRPESRAAGVPARRRLFRREIGGAVENIRRLRDLAQVRLFVALGSDMRFVARTLGNGDTAGSVVTLPAEKFAAFAEEVSRLSVDEIVDRFSLPFADAETLVPAMMIYSSFLAATSAKELAVPMVSIRDGLLLEMAAMVSGRAGSDFTSQILASARSLGEKYGYDEKHALHVTKLALTLFDELRHEEHQLGNRERLMLQVAGILHDIGVFVGNTAHHKHSRYLVSQSEIFGLRKAEKDLIAEIVRYHRKATPQPTHIEYMSLPRVDRVVVSKLAAILRVADALDRAHLQRVKDVRFERRKDAFVIHVPGVEDLAVERSGLSAKGDLFEEVFGLPVVLEESPG